MLNKVFLIGRLTKDPEVHYLNNGDALCNFGLATSEKWKTKTGESVEKTEFHNITMYRKLAEIAGKYLTKGSQVYLEGKIQSRKYQGKDGIERTAYDIIANEMKMLGGGNDGQQSAQHTPQEQPRRQAQTAPAASVVTDDESNEIPF